MSGLAAGQALQDEIFARDWTYVDFAFRAQLPGGYRQAEDLILFPEAWDREVCEQVAEAFDTSVEMWVNLCGGFPSWPERWLRATGAAGRSTEGTT